MIRFFVTALCVLFLMTSEVFAIQQPYMDLKTQHEKQEFISQIGFRLLNANKIKERMVFQFVNNKTVNALTSNINRNIIIYSGIMNYTTDEDEIAAILAHEISHGIDSYHGMFRGSFSSISSAFTPRKYERKADKRAVDFMVNAGYNPVAMIVMMNKTFPQYRYEFLSTHPLASRRMMYVYEYIYTKYPEYLKNNKYYDNLYYQNFLLTSQDNRRKLQNKIEMNYKGNIKYD